MLLLLSLVSSDCRLRGEWYSWAQAWFTDQYQSPVNLLRWISSSRHCNSPGCITLCWWTGQTNTTTTTALLSHAAGKGQPWVQGDNLHLCKTGPIFKPVLIPRVWCSIFVQITGLGIDGWFVNLPCGDWFCIPVGVLCNCPGAERSQCHKGLECACQSVSLAFWVAAQVSPKPRIHSRIKNSRRRFAVELGVVSCRWCAAFLCTSFSSKQYLASVSSELG